MERPTRGVGLYFIIIALILLTLFYFKNAQSAKSEYISNKEFTELLDSGSVSSVSISQNAEVPTGVVSLRTRTGAQKVVFVSDVNETEEMLKEKFPAYTMGDVKRESWFVTYLLPLGFMLLIMFMFMAMMSSQGGGANSKMMNFGRSRAKLSSDENKTKFDDVAGLKEEKEDLEEIVDFLKNPKKYIDVGARIPKGVILVGPPGTGKTLIAKAVAGEAKVPFFSASGSEFVEMFVGVGASRVRDLFAEAKKSAPCIIFIDEIDAVGRRRGSGMGGGHDEREQTLNQLLIEMDGFGVNEGIIVLAATNRVDILDPAILRPGRFDRKVMVAAPDVKGRNQILKVHSKNKPLGDDVNLEEIAKTTSGFTGADLENLMNEAAINAAKSDRQYINYQDVKEAFLKVGVGKEKRSKVVSDKEKKITAYHEAGHAILLHELPDMDPVYTISIIPTGLGAAGYTMHLPEKDEMFNTKGKMRQEIMVALGGRIAEAIIFDDITTGASSDIKRATSIAKNMIMKYGMSDEVGIICYDDDEEVFIGRDFGHTRSYSEDVAAKIDKEIKLLIDNCYKDAEEIILKNREVLHRVADLLVEKEKIGKDEFETCFGEIPQNEEV